MTRNLNISLQTKVVLISPNATLDLIYQGNDYDFSSKFFYHTFSMHGGGSGINVARALSRMKIDSTIYTLLGGDTGDMAHRLLQEEGLTVYATRGEAPTRTTAIQYQATGKMMAVSPTPRFTLREMEDLASAAKQDLETADLVFFGGSFPEEKALQEVITSLLRPIASRLIIDTRGKIMEALMNFPLLCAKADLSDLSGEDSDAAGEMDMKSWCLSKHALSASLVCTEGKNRIYGMYDGDVHIFDQFGDPTSRPYGRGDAFMAGILFGLLAGADYGRVVQLGILAGNCCGAVAAGMGSLDGDRFLNQVRNLLQESQSSQPKKASAISL